MTIRIRRLCTLTLISLLWLLGFAAAASAQGYIFNQLNGSDTTYPYFYPDAVSVGLSATLNLAVTNQSPTKLAVKGITITGAAAKDYSQTNTCGTELAPYGNCIVTVTFKPAAKKTLSATLNFADSAVGKPRTVNLTGVGRKD